MLRIASYFWQLCLLRASPAQLPGSGFSTMLILGVYLLVSIAVVSVTRPTLTAPYAVLTIAIGVILQASFTFALLHFKGRQHRFNATLAALLGTNAIMLLVLLPFNLILLQSESSIWLMLANSVTWVWLFWWLAIAGYIFHKAIEISVLQGACITFLIELFGIILAVNLIPE